MLKTAVDEVLLIILIKIIEYIILTILSLLISFVFHESGHYILARHYGYNPTFDRGNVNLGEYRYGYIGVKLHLDGNINDDVKKNPDRHLALYYAGIFPGLIGLLPLILYGNMILIAIFLVIYLQGCSLDIISIITIKKLKKINE